MNAPDTCERPDCGVSLVFVPCGGCGEDACPLEDETQADYDERCVALGVG